jgi:hypothetical protein
VLEQSAQLFFVIRADHFARLASPTALSSWIVTWTATHTRDRNSRGPGWRRGDIAPS